MIISFVNFKGGVAKTTSALSIAGELAKREKKILLIDLDPQGNLSSSLNRKGFTKNDDKTSMLLLEDFEKDEDIIIDTDIENIKIIPTCLYNLSRTMTIIDSDSIRRSDIRLKKSISKIKSKFDFILIDCCPADNLLNTNALVSSDFVIIPIKLDKYSLEGFDLLQEKIYYVKEESNDKLDVLGIIETMYKNTSIYKAIHQTLVESELNNLLFNSKIRSNIRIEESPFEFLPIAFYDESSNAAKDYKNLTDEIIERINEREKNKCQKRR